MKKWILNLHIYGGLLCSSYLIIFGISSLNFNHNFAFSQPKNTPSNWERSIKIEPLPDKEKYAEAVRDALGLMGWPLPWKMNLETNGSFHFDMSQPGKDYTIHVLPATGLVKVEERAKGVGAVVDALHGFNKLPNSRVASAWGGYTEFCVYVVIFAAFSGIYLWAISKRERAAGIIVLLLALVSSAALLAYARWGAHF